MPLQSDKIIDEMDELLSEYDVPDPDKITFGEQRRLRTRLRAAVERYAPPSSRYLKDLELVLRSDGEWWEAGPILHALRDDYCAGYLQSVTELIHADLFSDFLEMADHLIEQKYKDPAAVITGSVLEEHLRKLCDKNGMILKSLMALRRRQIP